MKKIVGYKYSSYLIGAMSITKEGDGGIASRAEVEKELLMRNVFPINPAKLEAAKTGISAADAIEKIIGWVASGKRELLQETGRQIWKGHNELNAEGNVVHIGGDLDYVHASDWLTFVLKVGDKPCGTYFEIGVAIDNNIPVYLITNIPKRDLPQSLILGIEAVGGEFFENLNQYLNFLDEKYKLKRVEPKEEKKSEETK
jgi:nucleoside 2-deoxyribosyltransferase